MPNQRKCSRICSLGAGGLLRIIGVSACLLFSGCEKNNSDDAENEGNTSESNSRGSAQGEYINEVFFKKGITHMGESEEQTIPLEAGEYTATFIYSNDGDSDIIGLNANGSRATVVTLPIRAGGNGWYDYQKKSIDFSCSGGTAKFGYFVKMADSWGTKVESVQIVRR